MSEPGWYEKDASMRGMVA